MFYHVAIKFYLLISFLVAIALCNNNYIIDWLPTDIFDVDDGLKVDFSNPIANMSQLNATLRHHSSMMLVINDIILENRQFDEVLKIQKDNDNDGSRCIMLRFTAKKPDDVFDDLNQNETRDDRYCLWVHLSNGGNMDKVIQFITSVRRHEITEKATISIRRHNDVRFTWNWVLDVVRTTYGDIVGKGKIVIEVLDIELTNNVRKLQFLLNVDHNYLINIKFGIAQLTDDVVNAVIELRNPSESHNDRVYYMISGKKKKQLEEKLRNHRYTNSNHRQLPSMIKGWSSNNKRHIFPKSAVLNKNESIFTGELRSNSTKFVATFEMINMNYSTFRIYFGLGYFIALSPNGSLSGLQEGNCSLSLAKPNNCYSLEIVTRETNDVNATLKMRNCEGSTKSDSKQCTIMSSVPSIAGSKIDLQIDNATDVSAVVVTRLILYEFNQNNANKLIGPTQCLILLLSILRSFCQ